MEMLKVMDVAQREDFLSQADPYRRELLAHCYRMTGSVHDAEDVLQETFIRAWKAYDNFEGRSSLRTWLYRIATTQCLTALEGRGRRPLPTGLGTSDADPAVPVTENTEVPWLEPIPDEAIGVAAGADPASVVTSRESVRLALIVALQHLPARQRAVLVLRDVLQMRAAEVAEVLDTTTVAVNSSLQRARATLAQVNPRQDEVATPDDPATRALVDQYMAAFEHYDIKAIVSMLAHDAVWEMPPFPEWFRGAENIGKLISGQCPAQAPGDMICIPTTGANGQPAFGLYMLDRAAGTDGAAYKQFQIQVLSIVDGVIDHVVAFFEPNLFAAFGLPTTVPAR